MPTRMLANRLVQSYGAMTEMMACMTSLEVVLLQALNQYFYLVAISRVQQRISLADSLFFFAIPLSDWK